jgi:outer membrane receptor protein involved in Fe transport
MKNRSRPPLSTSRAAVPLATAISAILAGVPLVHAADESSAVLDSVIVTAQKRSEDLQSVAMSVQAFNTEQLENLQVTDFNDYARLIPSVSFQTGGPGFARIYMRGVSSGDNGNHSGSLPSVGMYLDEQPITTIQGPLDIHLYDIARVEVLAGPQGTLYGASSQAGTIRIITNKPETGEFSAGYKLDANTVEKGSQGYGGEGFLNIPLADNAAIRLVGWAEHDAGYIDNVYGTRTYPTSGVTINNANRVKADYNDVDTYGARAALKIDLNDNWTITPTIMGQDQRVGGNFAMDPAVGDLELTHFFPESSRDRWAQAALTVEGKISNFDLVYAGAYLKRRVDSNQDYTDYSFFYDSDSGANIVDDSGAITNPSQYIVAKDKYSKISHELRLSSPAEWRAHFVTGLFMQRQVHDIEQRYKIDNIGASIEVPGWPDTIWLTEQQRVDRDYAVFGEVTFDFTKNFSGTAGLRYFKYENSLKGFFGYGAGYGSTGEAQCFSSEQFHGAPCVNLDKTVNDTGTSPKINFAYKFSSDAMIYATWSRGFRPGGVNRRGTFPPYDPDFLTSYELGWKTTWADGTLRFNGAVFREDWKAFQFSFLGENGLTNVTNAGDAKIDGVEVSLEWAVTSQLRLSAAASFLDAKLTSDFCKQLDADGHQLAPADCIAADPNNFTPADTELPVVPDFKGNVTGRYTFQFVGLNAHLQMALVYEGESRAALLPADSVYLHDFPSTTVLDLSTGIAGGSFQLELYVKNATDERVGLYRYVECATTTCGPQAYTVTNQPRTIGLQFGQKF